MTTNLVLEKEKERLAGKRKVFDVVLFKKGQRPSSALAKESSEVQKNSFYLLIKKGNARRTDIVRSFVAVSLKRKQCCGTSRSKPQFHLSCPNNLQMQLLLHSVVHNSPFGKGRNLIRILCLQPDAVIVSMLHIFRVQNVIEH